MGNDHSSSSGPSATGRSSVIGIDIGGANLKFATAVAARSIAFAMWSDHARLGQAVADVLSGFSKPAALALTMTGELADCFLDRAQGVCSIVDQVVQAARRHGVSTVAFYAVGGNFLTSDRAKQQVDLVAASNWHASAMWLATQTDKQGHTVYPRGLVIDVGSTTTDLIPLVDGKVATGAITDFDRLTEGSLVYVGCQRTPVCALVDHLRYQGRAVPVLNEFFATIEDALMVIGHHSEQPADHQTADGKPKTRFHSANRLARMIGLDHRQVSVESARPIASQIVQAASERIEQGMAKMSPGGPRILIGHGDGLVDLSGGPEVVRMRDHCEPSIVRSFPAYCVGRLYQQQTSVDPR